MTAMEPWCHLIGIPIQNLTKEEYILLEAEFFSRICEEIKLTFKDKYRNFFRLMKFTSEMENDMLQANYLRLIIIDILSTDEYNIKGIAYYSDTSEDVVQEVLTGRNTNPSAVLLQKIIELHRSVRRELYNNIIKKIISSYFGLLDEAKIVKV